MSPVDPISPTSSMDVSPISPMEARSLVDMPSTPIISSSLHLPRLVTSFQGTANSSSIKRMSIQFQLPTPSPLTLNRTPLTAVQRRSSAPWHRRCDAMYTEKPDFRDAMALPMSDVAASSARSPGNNELPPTTSTARRRVPSMHRQNANEGLHEMRSELTTGSPIIEQIVRIPLRLNMPSSTASSRASSDTRSQSSEQLTSQFQSSSKSTFPPTGQDSVACSKSSAASTKLHPRSPIHKRRRRRSQRLSHSLPTRIVVRRPQTLQDKYLQSSIAHLSSQLVPLISVRTGLPHPQFPTSLLQYHLLTHEQLDDLARWYHQTVDAGKERWLYPCPIAFGKVWCGSNPINTSVLGDPSRRQLVDLDTKRRRWGRFIGLRGCESPVDVPQQENIAERMEREWREAMRRAEEEAKVREKIWRGRF